VDRPFAAIETTARLQARCEARSANDIEADGSGFLIVHPRRNNVSTELTNLQTDIDRKGNPLRMPDRYSSWPAHLNIAVDAEK
jgi:hypothetical protein